MEGLILELRPSSTDAYLAAGCSYKHHPDNRGMEAITELVRFTLICRRCQAAPCVKACPRKALEKADPNGPLKGRLKRSSMLCTGCGTCAIACPFGTIYTQMIGYLNSVCDYCVGRVGQGQVPVCVQTSSCIGYGQIQPDRQMIELTDRLGVRLTASATWQPLVRRDAGG